MLSKIPENTCTSDVKQVCVLITSWVPGSIIHHKKKKLWPKNKFDKKVYLSPLIIKNESAFCHYIIKTD